MLIGIDIRSAIGQRAGIGNYARHLVENLSRLDNSNRYILYANASCEKAVFINGRNKNFEVKVFKCPLVVWHIMVFFDVLFRKIDLYLTPSYIIPAILPQKRCVIILCDITGYLFPEYHTLKVRMLTKLTKIAISKARLILTISKNTKNDIVSYFNVADHFVRVTHLAAAENFRVIEDRTYLNDIRIRHNLPDNYILFVGSIEPRKNLVGLISAFDKIKTKVKHKLVIVGGKGWLNSEIYVAIKEKKLENDVVFTGYVSDEELVALYNLADLFVYPSFYEGFGIPPLEAMACGTPVITSDTSSLPEVVGDAALMVNPKNTDVLASSIITVLNDETLRNRMVLDGLSRAKQFSWRRTADETLEIFEEMSKRDNN